MMSERDRLVLERVAARVRRRYPTADIRAFGSRARGTAEADSDFDVCIVLPHVDRATMDFIREIAWQIGFDNGCVITTVVLDEAAFYSGPLSESELVAAIRRDGVAA